MSASPSLRSPAIRSRILAGAAHRAAVLLALLGLAGGFPHRCAAQTDLSGRILDKAGSGIPGSRSGPSAVAGTSPSRPRRRRPTLRAAS